MLLDFKELPAFWKESDLAASLPSTALLPSTPTAFPTQKKRLRGTPTPHARSPLLTPLLLRVDPYRDAHVNSISRLAGSHLRGKQRPDVPELHVPIPPPGLCVASPPVTQVTATGTGPPLMTLEVTHGTANEWSPLLEEGRDQERR